MKKTVITIARSYGSGGRTLGKLLAEELGINCYDREILRMASDDSGIIFCQNTVIFKDHKKTVCLWYLFVIFITKMHRKYILNHCIFLLYLHLF